MEKTPSQKFVRKLVIQCEVVNSPLGVFLPPNEKLNFEYSATGEDFLHKDVAKLLAEDLVKILK